MTSCAAIVLSDCAKAEAKRHRTAVFLVKILRRPVADLHRRVVDDRVRPGAGFERGGINEGLEGGTRLPFCLDGAVELARRIIAAADQRPDRAGRIDRDEGRLRGVELAALLLEHVVQRLFGGGLKAHVERRFDGHIDLRLADQAFHLVDNHVGGIMLGAGPVALGLGRRLRHGGLEVAVGNVAFLAHGAEHDLGAGFGRLRIAGG